MRGFSLKSCQSAFFYSISFLFFSDILHPWIKMTQDLNCLQHFFGRVFGDPLHRTQCIWAQCDKSVSKATRTNAAIVLMIQRRSPADSLEGTVLSATKNMLCTSCSQDRQRLTTCARQLSALLSLQAGRSDRTSSQSPPQTVDMCPLLYQAKYPRPRLRTWTISPLHNWVLGLGADIRGCEKKITRVCDFHISLLQTWTTPHEELVLCCWRVVVISACDLL